MERDRKLHDQIERKIDEPTDRQTGKERERQMQTKNGRRRDSQTNCGKELSREGTFVIMLYAHKTRGTVSMFALS